jgi:hypothetical protein
MFIPIPGGAGIMVGNALIDGASVGDMLLLSAVIMDDGGEDVVVIMDDGAVVGNDAKLVGAMEVPLFIVLLVPVIRPKQQ